MASHYHLVSGSYVGHDGRRYRKHAVVAAVDAEAARLRFADGAGSHVRLDVRVEAIDADYLLVTVEAEPA